MIRFLLDVPCKRVVIVSSEKSENEIATIWDFYTVLSVVWVEIVSDNLVAINNYTDEVRIHVNGSVRVYNDENNWKVISIGQK